MGFLGETSDRPTRGLVALVGNTESALPEAENESNHHRRENREFRTLIRGLDLRRAIGTPRVDRTDLSNIDFLVPRSVFRP